MRHAIKQFMWPFQPHFCNGLERATRDVFKQIGFGLGARATLSASPTTGHSLVIIVSEDGMINLQPNLRRRVRREQVEQVVRLIEEQVVDNPDYEVFFRHWDT